MASRSQEALSPVPPYRPGVLPAKFPPVFGGGKTFRWSVPTGGMKGFSPMVCTGSVLTTVAAAGDGVPTTKYQPATPAAASAKTANKMRPGTRMRERRR
jgi:hypothetical protein